MYTLNTIDRPAVYDVRGNGDGETVPTITGDHGNRITDYTAVCIGNGQTNNMAMSEVCNTLDTMHDQQAVMVKAVDCRNGTESEINGTLQAKENGGTSLNTNNVCRVGTTVRRLTPLECERCQGFPMIRKVKFTEMTKDEYIAWNINEGHVVVDTKNGKVFATRGPGGIILDEPRELLGSEVNGYKVVNIRNGKTKMQCRIHRIVWIAEHGIIPDGYVIDHINNDKQDNRIENLQLLTSAENSTKARKDGLYKVHGNAGQAKITDEVHDIIQLVHENTQLTIKQLSELFGISKSRVQQIIHDEPWTDIGDWKDSKGRTHKTSDAARYKALGNSIALPFWYWLLNRISAFCKEKTMGSLFDGIGGFPLCWQMINGDGSCRWSSEIEPFCIAVTTKHFGDEEKGIKGDWMDYVKFGGDES